jgi:hypothetical protein
MADPWLLQWWMVKKKMFEALGMELGELFGGIFYVWILASCSAHETVGMIA